MNKALVLAAFLGLAASRSVSSWTYPTSGTPKVISSSEWFYLDFLTEADFGYGSIYMGMGPTETTMPYNTEMYGLQVYSYGETVFRLDAFKTYQWTGEYRFTPVNYVPALYMMTFYRPEDAASAAIEHVWHSLSWSLDLLNVDTKFTENMKTFEVSLYDVIDVSRDVYPVNADYTYDEDYENEYYDPYMSWALLEEFNVLDGTESWYGVHDYISFRKLF